MEEIKEIETVDEVENMQEEVIDRTDLNIQKFMDDMQLIGEQVNDKNLVKPNFYYGDASVTNYLLWLLLGEIMMLNNKLKENE
jgi:hypothetical protein